VSPPAISITAGIILFSQALRIIMQTPAAASEPADHQANPPAVFSDRRFSASHAGNPDCAGDRRHCSGYLTRQT
jgi:hypothetical protein